MQKLRNSVLERFPPFFFSYFVSYHWFLLSISFHKLLDWLVGALLLVLHMEHIDQLGSLQVPEVECCATLGHQSTHYGTQLSHEDWIPLKSSTACKYCNQLHAREQKVQTSFLRLVTNDPDFCCSALYLCCSLYLGHWTQSPVVLLPERSPSFSKASSSHSQEQTPHPGQKHIFFYLSLLPIQTGLGKGDETRV